MPDEPIEVEAPLGEPPILARPKPSNPSGWVVTIFLVVLLGVAQTAAYVSEFGKPSSTSQLEQKLSESVKILSSNPNKTEKAEYTQMLQKVADRASKDASRSDQAAKIAVVASHELGNPAPPQALDHLRESSDEVSRTYAEVYDGDDVTPELRKRLEGADDEGIVFELAKIHVAEQLGDKSVREQFVDPKLGGRVLVVGLVMFAAGLAGSALVLVFLGLRAMGRIVPFGLAGLDRADGDRLASRFATYLIIQVLAMLVGVQALKSALPGLPAVWLLVLVSTIVGLAAVLSLYVPVNDVVDSWRKVIGPTDRFFYKVGQGLFAYLCTVPLILASLALINWLSDYLPSPDHPLGEEFLSASGFTWLALFLATTVIAPVVEETMFRGVLFPALATRVKPVGAMVLCGLMFAIVHPQGPLLWPILATMGAVSAYLRYLTGSLVPSIALHVFHNGMIFFVGLAIG